MKDPVKKTTVEEKYTPVNKGHFDLDTEERVGDFRKKLAQGWEQDYSDYRRLWEELPKNRRIRDYPLLVDLELADICNLKCPMCPTVTEKFKVERKKGLMDFDLIKKIIDECAGKIYALRLSWVGEPTIHPKFHEAIKYAKDAGIKEVAFLTNASKLKLPYFEKLALAGADWITISIDGTHEEYEKVRWPLKWEDTLQKLKDIKKWKDENGKSRPVIKIQGVWPAIRPNPSGYYNTISPHVDLVAYNPLIDYLHKDTDIVYEDNFACPQHYQRLVIAADGRAVMCSSDDYVEEPIGNAFEQTIHEIWHGEKLNRMRELHAQKNGFLSIKPCANCFYPRKTQIDETATINGRQVLIENYVNRKQVIGE